MRFSKLALAGVVGFALGVRRALPGMSFAGKVVLITGGSRGLGLVLARLLARRGAQVAICARDGAELERARQDLGADTLTIACDVSRPAQGQAAVEQTLHRYGRLDVLINNAGIIRWAGLPDADLDNLQQHFAVHVAGSFNTIRAAWPHLVEQGYGRVVNTTSSGVSCAAPISCAITLFSRSSSSGTKDGLARMSDSTSSASGTSAFITRA